DDAEAAEVARPRGAGQEAELPDRRPRLRGRAIGVRGAAPIHAAARRQEVEALAEVRVTREAAANGAGSDADHARGCSGKRHLWAALVAGRGDDDDVLGDRVPYGLAHLRDLIASPDPGLELETEVDDGGAVLGRILNA